MPIRSRTITKTTFHLFKKVPNKKPIRNEARFSIVFLATLLISFDIHRYKPHKPKISRTNVIAPTDLFFVSTKEISEDTPIITPNAPIKFITPIELNEGFIYRPKHSNAIPIITDLNAFHLRNDLTSSSSTRFDLANTPTFINIAGNAYNTDKPDNKYNKMLIISNLTQ
jgi:hypothetical protein